MRLTVVGCAGSYPGPESAASCYLLEASYEGRTFRLLLDLGNGAIGPLQRYAQLDEIDAVALSHLHADHCLDLCAFYVVRKYHPDGPMRQLPVYGPEGTADRMARAYDIAPDPGMTAEFDFVTFPAEPFDVGPFTVTARRVEHPVPAYALRVSDGRAAVTYSGDTGPCSSLDEVAKDCDLLLAEASFVDGEDNPDALHMTGRDAAETAERAGVGQLVLTHIPAWYAPERVLAEARPHFSGDTSLASPGAVYDV
ncbi:MAG: MBL fold metallo-hydrolase [Nocardioidaceae bacterium]